MLPPGGAVDSWAVFHSWGEGRNLSGVGGRDFQQGEFRSRDPGGYSQWQTLQSSKNCGDPLEGGELHKRTGDA